MGLKDDYAAYLLGLTDEQVIPPETEPPTNGDPADMALLMADVTALFLAGATDFDIAVAHNLDLKHVALGREVWEAEIARREALLEI